MQRIKMNMEDMIIQDGFIEFINDRKRNNLSEATIKSYQANIHIFNQYLSSKNLHLKCSEVCLKTFEDYKSYLLDNIDNAITINTYLRHIKAIFNFFISRNYTQFFKMKMIKAEETTKDIYTREELEKLLERPQNLQKCRFSEYRNWVIINFILGTGCRLNTCRNILIKDIDFNEGYIFFRKTKTGKKMSVPLGQHLSKVLKEYISYRKPQSDSDILFCTETGNQMSEAGLKTAIGRYNLKHDVKKTSLHLFRHAYAKYAYLNGEDIVTLSHFLGHSNLEMTKHYLNLLCCDIKEKGTFQSTNPLEVLEQKNKKQRMTMKKVSIH